MVMPSPIDLPFTCSVKCRLMRHRLREVAELVEHFGWHAHERRGVRRFVAMQAGGFPANRSLQGRRTDSSGRREFSCSDLGWFGFAHEIGARADGLSRVRWCAVFWKLECGGVAGWGRRWRRGPGRRTCRSRRSPVAASGTGADYSEHGGFVGVAVARQPTWRASWCTTPTGTRLASGAANSPCHESARSNAAPNFEPWDGPSIMTRWGACSAGNGDDLAAYHRTRFRDW